MKQTTSRAASAVVIKATITYVGMSQETSIPDVDAGVITTVYINVMQRALMCFDKKLTCSQSYCI